MNLSDEKIFRDVQKLKTDSKRTTGPNQNLSRRDLGMQIFCSQTTRMKQLTIKAIYRYSKNTNRVLIKLLDFFLAWPLLGILPSLGRKCIIPKEVNKWTAVTSLEQRVLPLTSLLFCFSCWMPSLLTIDIFLTYYGIFALLPPSTPHLPSNSDLFHFCFSFLKKASKGKKRLLRENNKIRYHKIK